VKFKILGPVCSEVAGSLRAVPGLRQRTLLATLLISGNRPVPAEQLYTELWGESPPATAENSRQAHVYRLRQRLRRMADGGRVPTISTTAPGYVLEIGPDELDMKIFRNSVATARTLRTKDPGRARQILVTALDQWCGAPLQDVIKGPVCQSTALQLEEECITAQEEKLTWTSRWVIHIRLWES
jgi:SARP family transcriptional regulator, regulator of embCAB operon